MKNITIMDILRSKSSVITFKEMVIAAEEKRPDLLKRKLNYYVHRGELYAIRRGLYAKDRNYDKFELATKIYTPSYISFETVLASAGVIFQYYGQIFVASYQTREIKCDGQVYQFRKLKEAVLTDGQGIQNKGNYCVATKERAFLDTLYLNKNYYFDNLAPLDQSIIWALLPMYNNQCMVKRVERYFKKHSNEGVLR